MTTGSRYLSSIDLNWPSGDVFIKSCREMDEVTAAIHRKVTIILCLACVYFWLALVDIIRVGFLDAATFDKYIEIESINISDAHIEDWILIFDSTTEREVKLRDSYAMSVSWEYECNSGSWFSWRWNKNWTWIMDQDSNTTSLTQGVRKDLLDVYTWDKCFIRYDFTINNGYEDKYKTVSTNIFTIN